MSTNPLDDVLAHIGEQTSEDEQPSKTSQADLLVELAQAHYQFGQTQDGEPFALPHDGAPIIRTIRSGGALKPELAKAFYDAHGRTPSATSLAAALQVIEGKALAQRSESVHIRFAHAAEKIVIDLGRSDGGFAAIAPGTWEVAPRRWPLFRRSAATGQMPLPRRGGSMDLLKCFLNIEADSWEPLLGFLIASFFVEFPRPILFIGGPQGTGKSTAGRIISRLLDPAAMGADLLSMPGDHESWSVLCAGKAVICLDNVSYIPPWFSDLLCKTVTGEGSIKRRLYTNSDLQVFAFRRTVIITSIDAGALRGDLGDRLLIVDLKEIPDDQRRSEGEVIGGFEEALPSIYGALLDLVAAVMAQLPNVQLTHRPRMADFADILAALDVVLPTGGSALDSYLGQRDRIAEEVVTGDQVGDALLVLLARSAGGSWEGSPTDLLERLKEVSPQTRFPKSPSHLSRQLSRLEPALKRIGVNLERDRTRDAGRSKIIRLTDARRPAVHGVQPSEIASGGTDPPSMTGRHCQKHQSAVQPSSNPEDIIKPILDGTDDTDAKHPNALKLIHPKLHSLVTGETDIHRAADIVRMWHRRMFELSAAGEVTPYEAEEIILEEILGPDPDDSYTPTNGKEV